MAIADLPDFPWDRLEPAKARAAAHPGGIVDLSVGTPVDPTPRVARQSLEAASDAPGYPATAGTPELRDAVIAYLARRFGIADVAGLSADAVLPTIGAKEFVAWLPLTLGLGERDLVVVPELAYPTYAVGARIAGATPIPCDDPTTLDDATASRVRLIWLNSPANPTGRVVPATEIARILAWARDRGILLVSDECYLEYAWDAEPASVLAAEACAGRTDGLLAVYSMSKRSNLAGYRAGFVVGDPVHVARLLAVRKHAGMIVPRPVQQAMTAALGDDSHVDQQRARYAERRSLLDKAFGQAGFTIDHSEGSLYLWATRGESCWDTVERCAELGILVTPGDFYGAAGARHVRIAFTATDERVAAACERLTHG